MRSLPRHYVASIAVAGTRETPFDDYACHIKGVSRDVVVLARCTRRIASHGGRRVCDSANRVRHRAIQRRDGCVECKTNAHSL